MFSAAATLIKLLLLFGCSHQLLAQDLTQLQYHLQHLTEVRHPATSQPGPRERARTYIHDQFVQYGLDARLHHFNTSLEVDGGQTLVQGQNVVGVAAGDRQGGVLVVGADYDTTMQAQPLEDNGAGVAALLELARNYMQATATQGGSFQRINTVVFVAFDVNTRKYVGTGAKGHPGSYFFLHQWLWPFINQSVDNFAGALILDSISIFNMEPKSQYFHSNFNQTFPDAYKEIVENDKKGNFLAMVLRGGAHSRHLAQAFVDNYNKDRKSRLVRVQQMVLEDGAHYDPAVMDMIDHQAHYHFWTFQPGSAPTPLPAALLTDTGMYRKHVEGDRCPLPCSAADFLTRRRKTALTIVNNALTHTLLHLQALKLPTGGGGGQTVHPEGSGSWVVLPSTTASLTMLALTWLLHH